VREELRKLKEELSKERDELLNEQKKLLTQTERIKKTKEDLQGVLDGTQKDHSVIMPLLVHEIVQHATDSNPWVPILEAERSTTLAFHINVPKEAEVLKTKYLDQIKTLSNIVVDQNKKFDILLDERVNEQQEVISVALGKLKRRMKTKQEQEDEAGQEFSDSEEEQPQSPHNNAFSPRRPAAKSPVEHKTKTPISVGNKNKK
jgi:hypothetical protein